MIWAKPCGGSLPSSLNFRFSFIKTCEITHGTLMYFYSTMNRFDMLCEVAFSWKSLFTVWAQKFHFSFLHQWIWRKTLRRVAGNKSTLFFWPKLGCKRQCKNLYPSNGLPRKLTKKTFPLISVPFIQDKGLHFSYFFGFS